MERPLVMNAAPEKLRFRVGGMDCAACVTTIENAVARLPGVGDVAVSLASGTMTVSPDGAIATAAVERQVRALGYSIAPPDAARLKLRRRGNGPPEAAEGHLDIIDGPWWRSRKAMLIVVCGSGACRRLHPRPRISATRPLGLRRRHGGRAGADRPARASSRR